MPTEALQLNLGVLGLNAGDSLSDTAFFRLLLVAGVILSGIVKDWALLTSPGLGLVSLTTERLIIDDQAT